jgi:YD repeat-containing protein
VGAFERSLVRLPVLLRTLIVLLLCVGASDAQVSTRYVYDPLGRLVQVIEADGTTVTYNYDSVGNLLTRLVTRPADAAGAITSIYPTAVEPATESDVTIFGVGLTAATGVTFDVPGITASLDGAPQDTALSLSVRVEATVSPGPHTFTVHRAPLPPIASGAVALNVTARPVLVGLAPAQVLTGATVDQFTLSGARLDHSPTVVFDRSGLVVTGVTTSADGTALTGRLQVALNTVPGPVGVSVTTSEGSTKKVALTVARSVSGLTGSYFANVFTLDGAGLPVVPVTSPSFIRSDAALQFGVSTGFGFRPCFIATSGCLNGAYTVRWQGHIFLESAGTYTFALNSSDASQLLIGGGPVVSNPGTHAATTAQGVFVAPAPGSYPLVVIFNSSGSTPGIDLLYRPPGAAMLSLVPGTVLWGDGGAYDPTLTSAVTAVSVSNPTAPALGGTGPSSSATAAVSFLNPAPTTQPGGVAPTNATATAVSFLNPAPTTQPGGVAPTNATATAVSFFSPGTVPAPGGAGTTAAASAAVSFTNPSPVAEPGGTAPIASASASVSVSNPAPVISPGGSAPSAAALGAVAYAAGPVVYQVTPTQLSRGAGGGVLTITGRNMQNATAVQFENGSGMSASAPSSSADGGTVTTTVTLTDATPTGFVGVSVSTPTGVSAAAIVLEIVP